MAVYNGANFRTNIAPPTDAAITLSDIPEPPGIEDHKRARSTRNASPRVLTQAGYDGITPDETKVYFISG